MSCSSPRVIAASLCALWGAACGAPALGHRVSAPSEPVLLVWSAPVNGLRARIEMPDLSLPEHDDAIFIRLENVGSGPLTVPASNRPGPGGASAFELFAERSGSWSPVRWAPEKPGRLVITFAATTGPDGTRLAQSLAPGESILCYLAGSFASELRKASRVKVVLREASAEAPQAWTGVLQTPSRPVYVSAGTMKPHLAAVPLPTHLPDFSRRRNLYGNTFDDEGFRLLSFSNMRLFHQLRLYDPTEVVRALERRAEEETDVQLKILLAARAAAKGSERGRAFLLECRQSTDYETVKSALYAFRDVASSFVSRREPVPDWVVEAMIGAVADDRRVAERSPRKGYATIAVLADQCAHVTWMLGQRGATWRRTPPASRRRGSHWRP